ncbi:MAG: HypC/HybG/HupF family hydrogenase formation chaperone [Pseudomonadota bacterium]
MGIPLKVVAVGTDGRAQCVDRSGERVPALIDTALLDHTPASGSWLLTHIDVALRSLEEDEAGRIADALEALQRASRGEDFEHLISDLIDREPQLPPHLQEQLDA